MPLWSTWKTSALNSAFYSQTEKRPVLAMSWAVVNVPIIEDVLGIRLSYQRNDDPGYGVVFGNPTLTILLPIPATQFAPKYTGGGDNLNLELTIQNGTRNTVLQEHRFWIALANDSQPNRNTNPLGTLPVAGKKCFEISWTTFHADLTLALLT